MTPRGAMTPAPRRALIERLAGNREADGQSHCQEGVKDAFHPATAFLQDYSLDFRRLRWSGARH